MSNLSSSSLDTVVAACQHERSTFRRQGETSSPACLEVFRRAFAGDQDAWAAVYGTFSGLIRAWIGSQRVVDPEDAAQEAFRAFAQHAPQALNLEMYAQLAPVLAYLRRCTMTAVIRLLRHAQAARQLHEQFQNVEIGLIEETVSFQNLDEETTARVVLSERVPALLFTDEERLVCRECLIHGRRPAELPDLYPEHFTDVKDVNNVRQRIVRRLQKDQAIRDLVDWPAEQRQKSAQSRSLSVDSAQRQSGSHFRKGKNQDDTQIKPIHMLNHAEEHDNVNTSCHLDQEQLLDYVLGIASTAIAQTIEQTPACRLAADRLTLHILPLMGWLRRLECPDADSLVAYYEQQLDSTTQLVIDRHVSGCPHCQAERQILEQMAAMPLEAPSGPVRRLIEAIFQSPLARPQPVRGEMLTYIAPSISIHLSSRVAAGQARRWILRGQARSPDGLQLQDVIEAVELHALDSSSPTDIEGFVEPHGNFVFRDLLAGTYSLHVLTSDEEIVIRQIIIGE